MCLGVSFIHTNNMCHWDLKLDNVLFKDKNQNIIKIIDFGLSQNNIEG